MPSPPVSIPTNSTSATTAACWSTTTTPRANVPASPACWATCAPLASASPISTPASRRWKTSLSAWCIRHELPRDRSHLQIRDVAHRPHPGAEYRLAGGLDLALFRGVWRCDRLAHQPGRRCELRHLHRAGTDHAVGFDPEHL